MIWYVTLKYSSHRNFILLWLNFYWDKELLAYLFMLEQSVVFSVYWCGRPSAFVICVYHGLVSQHSVLGPVRSLSVAASPSSGLVCQKGMMYHHCASFCRRSCVSLSAPEQCHDDCAEGCNCPEGKYYEDTLSFCVPMYVPEMGWQHPVFNLLSPLQDKGAVVPVSFLPVF